MRFVNQQDKNPQRCGNLSQQITRPLTDFLFYQYDV